MSLTLWNKAVKVEFEIIFWPTLCCKEIWKPVQPVWSLIPYGRGALVCNVCKIINSNPIQFKQSQVFVRLTNLKYASMEPVTEITTLVCLKVM